MAFASWYSIRKWLPDCKVFLEVVLEKPMFGWANRLGVKTTRKAPAEFKIQPTTMILREFSGEMHISSSKTNAQTAFVDYADGCGNFVVDEWLNSSNAPFERALKNFGTHNLTVNEMATLTAWERCHHVYQSVGGS